MIRFTLFGIPVEIQPWFWLTTAILGGGFHANSREGLIAMLLFMIAAFISILVHEFGHALVGRKFGGGWPRITLHAMGGLAHCEGARFSSSGLLKMIAAGPGAGMAFGALIICGLYVALPAADAANLVTFSLLGVLQSPASPELKAIFSNHLPAVILLRHFLWINFWWSLVNLLPILPLDGGRIAELFVRPRHRMFQIGAIAATGMALFGWLAMGSLFVAVMFGFFAWNNYRAMKNFG
jgi:stage IV sporulation protein FB